MDPMTGFDAAPDASGAVLPAISGAMAALLSFDLASNDGSSSGGTSTTGIFPRDFSVEYVLPSDRRNLRNPVTLIDCSLFLILERSLSKRGIALSG
jgi:hypothetical protein